MNFSLGQEWELGLLGTSLVFALMLPAPPRKGGQGPGGALGVFLLTPAPPCLFLPQPAAEQTAQGTDFGSQLHSPSAVHAALRLPPPGPDPAQTGGGSDKTASAGELSQNRIPRGQTGRGRKGRARLPVTPLTPGLCGWWAGVGGG